MRYALFSGDDYYPCGGWDDFQGTFGTLEQAQAAYTPRDYGWAQIVDLEALLLVVHQGGRHGEWRPNSDEPDLT